MQWQQKTALVTGANRGIGLALVKALIARKVKRIYLGGRDLAALEQTIQELGASSSELVAIQLDVTSAADIAQASRSLSELDILINNAGIANSSGFIQETSGDIAQLEMATNYFGPVNLTRALLPQLQQSSQAAIINISSIAGIANMPLLGPYSASKAALHSFTQGLRAELAKSEIFVQGVYPGPVATRMSEGFELSKALPAEVADIILTGVEQKEEDIFPDAMSANWYNTFKTNPKQLEQEYASWLG
ncbi:SDR family NAD(P)-dependent oxidoreductase [Cellvibrio sp. OA-2007]|uniref:SDR family NAD(P)-dependent oxidoreductase n=1 Tax=Cellvibrio sp. OA-2007 TaxID=529823 RepID=UPI00078105E1|nr:SDR family NAD(P)-dependent oxidoreductase [Cellvibrio sp. OA-2007]